MDWLIFLTSLIVTLFVGALAALVLWAVINGKIDLTQLVCEPGGKASLARFQFLIFSVVIALSFLAVALRQKTMPGVPAEVLYLLAISGGTYLISKGIASGGGRAR